MFTTRRVILATKRTNEWRKEDKLAMLTSHVTSKFAPDLATDFLLDVRRFASAAVAENDKRSGGDRTREDAGRSVGRERLAEARCAFRSSACCRSKR